MNIKFQVGQVIYKKHDSTQAFRVAAVPSACEIWSGGFGQGAYLLEPSVVGLGASKQVWPWKLCEMLFRSER